MCVGVFLMLYQLFMENLQSDHKPVTLRSHSTKGHVDLQHCKTVALALITVPGILSPHCIFSHKVHPINFKIGKDCKSKFLEKIFVIYFLSYVDTYSLNNQDFKLGYHNKHLSVCMYL